MALKVKAVERLVRFNKNDAGKYLYVMQPELYIPLAQQKVIKEAALRSGPKFIMEAFDLTANGFDRAILYMECLLKLLDLDEIPRRLAKIVHGGFRHARGADHGVSPHRVDDGFDPQFLID